MNCKSNYNCRPGMQPRPVLPVSSPQVKACDSLPAGVTKRVSCDMLQGLPLAMAYVPRQHYDRMFELSAGLKMGTIFPELCLPFCGKRGKCSC